MKLVNWLTEFLKILLLAIFAAVCYGVVHDQVTARVCVEYFTVAHPPVFHTDSPTLLGLGWGVIATWWVGALLGSPAALVSLWGNKLPKLAARDLIRPLAVLLGITGCLALLAGVLGYVLGRAGMGVLEGDLASAIPADKHAAFLAAAAAHLTSYGCGSLGGIVLCFWIWRRRRRLLRISQTRAYSANSGTTNSGITPAA